MLAHLATDGVVLATAFVPHRVTSVVLLVLVGAAAVAEVARRLVPAAQRGIEAIGGAMLRPREAQGITGPTLLVIGYALTWFLFSPGAAVPGMVVSRSGDRGKLSSVFTRGTNSNHTLFLIDGVRVMDSSASNASFQLEHLDAANIERVEIIHGPQSTLYGSDAIGGVINVITRVIVVPARRKSTA